MRINRGCSIKRVVTMASNLQRAAELKEASLLVRYAAGCLNETERASVVGFAEGLTQETIAQQRDARSQPWLTQPRLDSRSCGTRWSVFY